MERKRIKINITVRPETYELAKKAAEAADTSVSRYIEGLIIGIPYGRQQSATAVQPSEKSTGRPHKKFEPPTLQDVITFAASSSVDVKAAEKFYHHYSAQAWNVGKKKLWDWRERLLAWSVEDEQRAAQRREDNLQRAEQAEKRKGMGFLNFTASGADWDEASLEIMGVQEKERIGRDGE